MIDIEKLSELCAAASPGPWLVVRQHMAVETAQLDKNGEPYGHELWAVVANEDNSDEDVREEFERSAPFIAVARTAMPECLDEIKRLRAEVARLCVASADEHVALRAEIERLQARQQELLRDFARVTQQMPFADEVNQVPTLIAEVGTLRAANERRRIAIDNARTRINRLTLAAGLPPEVWSELCRLQSDLFQFEEARRG